MTLRYGSSQVFGQPCGVSVAIMTSIDIYYRTSYNHKQATHNNLSGKQFLQLTAKDGVSISIATCPPAYPPTQADICNITPLQQGPYASKRRWTPQSADRESVESTHDKHQLYNI